MKLGKKGINGAVSKLNVGRPAANQAKKNGVIMLILAVAVALIIFVVYVGSKATTTVDVVMLKQSVHKNQRITSDMLKSYPMIKAEYEKYSTKDANGKVKGRIITWENREVLDEAYAAYPLQANTWALYSSFLKSRSDNSDSVLYSFPGKEIVKLDINSSDLNSFKSYLQPGDTINIQATYMETLKTPSVDAYGYTKTETNQMFKTETVFNDIALADMLNSSGQSILDLYSDYNEMSTYEQSSLDANEEWKTSVIPSTILLALTPEEKDRYYSYLSRDNIEFRVSLPQRSN